MTESVEFRTLLPVIGFSVFLFFVCMTIFGYAVEHEWNRLFAPRSWARPKAIIKNQIRKPYCFSWIFWALQLSYAEMLDGIEGTGTRRDGWSGPKLRCNLDGIILIKFVNLCLKVSVLATLLCVGIVLPVNFNAVCVPEQYPSIEEGLNICGNTTNVTTFEKTTFAHIPSLVYYSNSSWYSADLFANAFSESTGITLRMLTTVLVSFVIYTYTCVLIWEEWIQNLALRRVYYLEYNHYKHRKEELDYIKNLTDPEDVNTKNRPVYVVHPEYRDTVPNIGLYSVLFRLPGVQLDDDLSCANNSVELQLKVATEFFDKIVPNQPGFTSSIAALTILPDVKRLSQAWRKWFECASKVRRLKFIRQRIKELEDKQKYENLDDDSQLMKKGCEEEGRPRYASVESTVAGPRLRNGGEFDLESARASESNNEMFLKDDECEQMIVYYREFSRSSAACGPYGCDEYVILQADSIDTLKLLEEEANDEVEDAVNELHDIRKNIQEATTPFSQVQHEHPAELSTTRDGDVEECDWASSCLEVQRTGIIEATKMLPEDSLNLWEEAEKLVGTEQYMVKLGNQVLKRKLNTGSWYVPCRKQRSSSEESITTTRRVVENVIPSGVLSRIVKSESYAVVTFTSRQAAIAARQCLSDGSGLDGWREVDKIPVPPLADAVPWNIFDCRGCCRPVTVTIPPHQRRIRFRIVVAFLIIFSTIWTYPFYLFTDATTPEELARAFPDVPNIDWYAKFLSPWLNSGVMIGFFAVLPQIFKLLANSDGEATSIQEAERHALIYYWWFMLVFVFAGKSLGNIVWTAFRNNKATLRSATEYLEDLTRIVPTTQSFYWITWMITQTGVILPFMYFLQFNNFMFTALKWDCCARATAGGGPGGLMPYRVYVNSGVIFLCVVALSPLCPMVAPFSTLFFLFITPLLKWAFIFVYRPTFDAGGMRWPLLHRILMISVIVSQFILAISLSLKKAFLLSMICLITIIFTWTFKNVCEDTFEESFNDAALLQTSELDGWNVDERMSSEERERYRKWIVDCHKAAYVPVCVNAEDNYLTSEPAVVISTEEDNQFESAIDHEGSNDSRDQSSISSPMTYGRQRTSTLDSYNSHRSQRIKNNHVQPGALFRRIAMANKLQVGADDHNSIISEESEFRGGDVAIPRQFQETNLSNLQKESREKSS
mmetsp:Transcript_18278/g.50913  ORF Transcript_18278/g.50913 Transcript_18278/m.50913 type:complete len:1171 (+) Transcript_18278:158-3670(+)